MRLPVDGYSRLGALVLALGLSGCVFGGGSDRVASTNIALQSANGPSADYPMVLGEPYSIDGVEYIPTDVMNYDEVGDAAADTAAGVNASHRTLPLPSYIEVTSLETGRTILVRVERRGPMDGSWLVGLSTGAREQLAASAGTPVRVRRVNPPEGERALLRAGEAAPERLETPMSLVAVLKRKLPEAGSVSLAAKTAQSDKENPGESNESKAQAPVLVADASVATEQAPVAEVSAPEAAEPQLAAINPAVEPAPEPQIAVVDPVTEPVSEPVSVGGALVVQAATFSVEANARRAANALEGFVVPAGKFFRVRTGPYSSRGQADAALAKVKAAGYSDARVIDAG